MHSGYTNNSHHLDYGKLQRRPSTSLSKIRSENKQKKFVKEQTLIVHLGLGLEEAYHPWSKDGDEYTALQPIEHFVKVCLPLTKAIKVPIEAPMEHPRLPAFPILGTLASDVRNYYTEQATTDSKLRLKTLREREKEAQMCSGIRL